MPKRGIELTKFKDLKSACLN